MTKNSVPRPVIGLLAALALLAAACSSDSGSQTLDAAAPDDPAPTEPADSTEPAPQPSADAESETDPASESEAPEATAGADGDAESEAPAAEPAEDDNHLFPDVSTVNVKSGDTINLAAELAGGDTPVLFWFFAPH